MSALRSTLCVCGCPVWWHGESRHIVFGPTQSLCGCARSQLSALESVSAGLVKMPTLAEVEAAAERAAGPREGYGERLLRALWPEPKRPITATDLRKRAVAILAADGDPLGSVNVTPNARCEHSAVVVFHVTVPMGENEELA